jgi:S-DNA-T family DNA segregation ATPase FtsK/SpoIIIE
MLQHRSSKELEVRMSSSKPMDFMPFTMVPHGRGQQIADDHQSALHMVSGLVAEMDRRIRLISEAHCDNLVEYNAEHSEPLRYIVAVIDEYAETVISFSDKSDRSEFENGVARLAQKARAAGIHLILCMQRPDSTVLEGRIKSNVLHRFALKLPQSHDSRVILDESGAEALLGKGDMLYKDADGRLFRLQVPFLDKSVLTQRIDRLRGE